MKHLHLFKTKKLSMYAYPIPLEFYNEPDR